MRNPVAILLLASVTLGACSKPQAASLPATLRTPVPANELRALLPGHFIDEQPFPCDGGPLILRADNSFLQVSGWQDIDGTYVITDGAIKFQGHGGASWFHPTMRVTKDGNGKLYYSGLDGDSEHALKLVRMGPGTTWITCGSTWNQPPPPAAPSKSSR